MMLFLDTSGSDQTFLYLLDGKGIVKAHAWNSKRTQAETLHLEIDKFLKKSKAPLNRLKKIGVVVGPGFFSRVRTGVVTANTLAYALKIPVVGVKKLGTGINFSAVLKQKGTRSVEAFYDRKPNITIPKKQK
jgi:tRNA threonylcarbamoyladenosine biosynthesis protein TsaB